MKPSMQNEATKMQMASTGATEPESEPEPKQRTELRLMDVDFTNSNGKNMQASAAQRCLRLQLRLRLQLQRQPLRHCCRKCDNLATNMRWLQGEGGPGGSLPPKEDITQCICVRVGVRSICTAAFVSEAQKWDKVTHRQAAARATPPHTSLHQPSALETYCRFQLPTANWCRCSALIPSVHRAPAPQSPPACHRRQLEHRNKCAFMASNSKVFKIFTFHALCLTQTSDRAESFFCSPDTL